jgi:hypothetical protein
VKKNQQYAQCDGSHWSVLYVRFCLGTNDNEVLTSSPLYLQEGDYCLPEKFVVSDGDGKVKCP